MENQQTTICQILQLLNLYDLPYNIEVTVCKDGHLRVFIEVQGLENSITITGSGWALVSTSTKNPNKLYFSYWGGVGRVDNNMCNKLIEDDFTRFLTILSLLAKKALPELFEKMLD